MKRHLADLLIPLLLWCTGVVGTFLFWRSNAISGSIAVAVVALGLWRHHTRQDVIFYVLGFVLGITGELSSVHNGVWTYANPFLLGSPAFLPVLWGFTFLVAFRVLDSWRKLTAKDGEPKPPNVPDRPKQAFLLDLALYALIVLLAITLWRNNEALTAAYALILVALLVYSYSGDDLFFAVGAGLLGPIWEITSIHLGIWWYANPTFLGIPLWLPLLYATFAVVVRRTSICLHRLLP